MPDFDQFNRALRKIAASTGGGSRDKDLWEQWHRTKSPQDLQAVLDQLAPIINREVNRWAGGLARATLETQAKALTVKAIQSYDPKHGAALSTHVVNQLQKLSRLVYTHTQAARLPEHKAVAMTSFSVAHEMLQSDLGRPPSSLELSEHLGWSKARTTEFQKVYGRKELLSSGQHQPSAFAVDDSKQDPVVDYVYHDMSPEHQRLFEHITGYGGAPILSNPDLMKKFDMTQGQLSYQKRKLIALVGDATKGR